MTIPTVTTVTIDMDKKCVECGKGGALPIGICLACTLKAMRGETMRSQIGRSVQKRFSTLSRDQQT